MNTTRTLNDVMEFDHVIRVHEDGSISEPSDVFAPEMNDGEVYDGWELLTGFTGQYGYSGPMMHASEFVGGGLERHIRETPGLYVALVDYSGEDEPDGWAVAYRES